MLLQMNKTSLSEKCDIEREYRFIKQQKFSDGLLDTRIRLTDFHRDVENNFFELDQNLEHDTVSCVYVAPNYRAWENVAHLPYIADRVVFPALGMLPHSDQVFPQKWETDLKCHLTMNPNMWIGEIGFRLSETDSMPVAQQTELVEKQLKIAHFFDRPVLLSASNAASELLSVLDKNKEKLPRMVISAADVPVQLLPQFRAIPNLYYGFSPFVMDSRGYKERQVLQKIPVERVLLESKTDVKNCHSAALPHVANFIAKNLRIERKEMRAILEQNNQRVLGD